MKTIEEAKDDCILNCGCLRYRESDYAAGYANGIDYGFESGVEFAQRWISVEDELPQEGTSVLIKNDFGYFGINVLENGIWRMCTVEKIAGLLNLKEYELEKFAMPTHWRPIELK